MPKMYIKYRNSEPYAYVCRDEKYAAEALYLGDGYRTPEEALEAWRKEQKCKIKPCPFCGGTNAYYIYAPDCWVRCPDCGANGPERSSIEQAIEAWNWRAENGGTK